MKRTILFCRVAFLLISTMGTAAQSQAQRPRPVPPSGVSSVGTYASTTVTESGEAVAILELKDGKSARLTRVEPSTGKTVRCDGNWGAGGGKIYVSLTLRDDQPYKERITFQRTGDVLKAIDYDSTRYSTDDALTLSRAEGSSDIEFVTGIVTYRARIALPPDAVVTVVLSDVSRADAAATVLSRRVLKKVSNPPIPFKLGYRKGGIDARHTYAVQARITSGKQVLFVTTRRYAVLTNNAPRVVEVVVDLVQK